MYFYPTGDRLSPVGVMFCCGKVWEGGFNNLSRNLFVTTWCQLWMCMRTEESHVLSGGLQVLLPLPTAAAHCE